MHPFWEDSCVSLILVSSKLFSFSLSPASLLFPSSYASGIPLRWEMKSLKAAFSCAHVLPHLPPHVFPPSYPLPSRPIGFARERLLYKPRARESGLLLRPAGYAACPRSHGWSGKPSFNRHIVAPTAKGLLNEAGGLGLSDSPATRVQLVWDHPTWREELLAGSSHQPSMLTAAEPWCSAGLGWSPSTPVVECSSLSLLARQLLCQPGVGGGWSVGVWSCSILFSTLVLARMLCPPSSKPFSFCFLIAFSSLTNLPLAYQKLWLSKVLFLIWDQELILEVKILNTDYSFLSVSTVLLLFQVLWELCKEEKKRKAQTLVFQDAFLPWHLKYMGTEPGI